MVLLREAVPSSSRGHRLSYGWGWPDPGAQGRGCPELTGLLWTSGPAGSHTQGHSQGRPFSPHWEAPARTSEWTQWGSQLMGGHLMTVGLQGSLGASGSRPLSTGCEALWERHGAIVRPQGSPRQLRLAPVLCPWFPSPDRPLPGPPHLLPRPCAKDWLVASQTQAEHSGSSRPGPSCDPQLRRPHPAQHSSVSLDDLLSHRDYRAGTVPRSPAGLDW